MTYEIRVNVDADMYFRPVRPNGEVRHNANEYVACDIIKNELERYFGKFDANHKFINIEVKSIPHDNDRDYTDEDVEKHLNGEPKKRKTYAEDFFEKFPDADRNKNGYPTISFAAVHGLALCLKLYDVLEYLKTTGRIDNDVYIWELPMEDEDADTDK